MFKKMTVLVSVENGCAAEKVLKSAKTKLGIEKGGRVLKKNGRKVLFVSGIVQKTIDKMEDLDRHKDYDMVVIPVFGEAVNAAPHIHAVKIHMNNNLGFSVFVCAVPPKPSDKEVADAADNIADIVTANIS
jgi:hypothetical protein